MTSGDGYRVFTMDEGYSPFQKKPYEIENEGVISISEFKIDITL